MQEDIFQEELKKCSNQLSQCDWIKEEFRGAAFADKRIFLRFLVVAEHLAKLPQAPINQASVAWNMTKAAYRFFDNKKVTAENILQAHKKRTFQRIIQHSGVVLIIQDTSFLNYSHMKSALDLGPIGELKSNSMGLMMHSSLAVTQEGLPLGIVDQQVWARSADEHGKSSYRHSLPPDEKESFKWTQALTAYSPQMLSKTNIITVCDREADIYDFFCEANKQNAQVLVRAQHDRNTDEGKKLWDYIEEKPVRGTMAVQLPSDRKDIANLKIRFGSVKFPVPKRKKKFNNLKTLSLYAVYVHELNPPTNREALSWLLITNVPVTSLKQAKKCIGWYKQRWKIEIFHKVMKSGCSVELTRLETNSRRFPFLALKTVIAWKLLMMTLYNKISPDDPATAILTQAECNALYSITHNTFSHTKHTFNAQKAIKWLAQLGGYLARRSDPLPGPTHVWKGWQRLQDFTRMYMLTAS